MTDCFSSSNLWTTRCRTFEFDDYPRDAERLQRLADSLRARFPAFRLALFCIPAEMDREAWRWIDARRDWVRPYPHGFLHAKAECRDREIWSRRLRMLDRLAHDDRWGRLFKSPWWGYSAAFLSQLHMRGFSPACKTLSRWPLVIPGSWTMWNIEDAQYRAQIIHPDTWQSWHVCCHPVYRGARARLKASVTEISRRHVRLWSRHWSEDDIWSWPEHLLRRSRLLINLGCGDQVLDGWLNLDPRADELGRGVVSWSWSEQIPVSPCKADMVLTSHVMEYAAEPYEEHLLEIWRVLRPGGIVRMSEQESTRYVWRRIGARNTRGTGSIVSYPTRDKIVSALTSVGFEVLPEVGPGVSHSPYWRQACDTRPARYRRGHKFIVEARKPLDVSWDLSRVNRWDRRATKIGRWRLPYDGD